MLLAASGQLRAAVRGVRGPAAMLALLYCAAVPSSASGPRQTTAPPELRLHHFHIEVEDAALAMREAAPAHLLIVSADLTHVIHGHPEEQMAAGPGIAFDPVLPRAGLYKLWIQVQRDGRVITVPFVIEVAPL